MIWSSSSFFSLASVVTFSSCSFWRAPSSSSSCSSSSYHRDGETVSSAGPTSPVVWLSRGLSPACVVTCLRLQYGDKNPGPIMWSLVLRRFLSVTTGQRAELIFLRPVEQD